MILILNDSDISNDDIMYDFFDDSEMNLDFYITNYDELQEKQEQKFSQIIETYPFCHLTVRLI